MWHQNGVRPMYAPVQALVRGHEADASLDPDGPRRQAVDEEQREVGDGGAAVALDLRAHTRRRMVREGESGIRASPAWPWSAALSWPGMWCEMEANERAGRAMYGWGRGGGRAWPGERCEGQDGEGARRGFRARMRTT